MALIKSKMIFGEKTIDRNKVISESIYALRENGLSNFFKKLNNILLKELDIDYSSFFLNAFEQLSLYETNIESEELKRDIVNIKTYENDNKNDFKEGIKEKKVIVIEGENKLLYPTAYHRSIRTAIFMPLDDIGFWLVEDNRKIGNDNLIASIVELSKQIEIIINLYKKKYFDEDLNIYTLEYLISEVAEITRSIAVIEIENLNDICAKYGYSLRREALEIVIFLLNKENSLRGGIGISQNYIWIFSLYDSLEEILNKIVTKIEKMKLTIEKDTINLLLNYETEKYFDGAAAKLLEKIKIKK